MEESYDNKYRIGVYGSRNICQKVCSLTKAESSFVADMSTGYSGNLGYSMPNNWAFEQFHEYSILGSGFSFAVDKDMASGRYKEFLQIPSVVRISLKTVRCIKWS